MPLIYLYSHDGEGLGHFRRNLNIAQQACSTIDQMSALLMTGSLYPGLFQLPHGCDYVKIPTLQKFGRDRYNSQLGGKMLDTSAKARKDLLKAVVKSQPPDMLIVDKHPGGLHGELIPALKWLRDNSPGTSIVFGLRDILDTPEEVRHEWEAADVPNLLKTYYDRAWIYGDPEVYDTIGAYSFAPQLRRIATSVGYLTKLPHQRPMARGSGFSIVATAGGGHDGFPVLRETIAAVRELDGRFGKLNVRLFTGPLMSEADHRRLKEFARSFTNAIRIERFSQRLQRNIASADVVICMGGYNSLIEGVSVEKPVIVVPREHPRKEQLIRAEAFERAGYVSIVRQDQLEKGTMTERLTAMLSGESVPVPIKRLNIRGLDHVASQIRELLSAPEPTADLC